MPPTGAPLIFDRTRLRRRRDRRAGGFGDYDFLKARVSSALMERLADTPRRFPVALDLGAHDGLLTGLLTGRPGASLTIGADLSAGMAAAIARRGHPALACDEERLPFAPGCLDLVASALSLHWVNDLPGTLVQIRQALKPDGLFLAALLGAGTLGELRTSLSEAETELTGGAALRVSPLPGLRDMAGLMQRAGFALPVADAGTVLVRHDSLDGLLRDLGGMAERAAFAGRPARPLPGRVLARAGEIYRARFSDPDGRVRASFQVIYLSGWAPGPGQPQPKARGSATVSLKDVFGKPERDGDG